MRGTHHKFSDIDILFKENPEHPITSSEISKIKEEIENSNLTIKVDLVNDEDLAKSYRASVDNDKVKL